jgi:flagellar biosynthesis protein FlhF
MRLRSFTGRTMNEAMGLVREHLGPDAIIVSTQEDEEGSVVVTAALDSDAPDDVELHPPGAIDALGVALAAHGVSPELTEKILTAALPFDMQEPLVALSSALATLYPFKPIAAEPQRSVFLLAGPPGAGKTVTAAKLAARSVLAGKRIRLISADAAKAGAADQLAAFARILKVPLQQAKNARDLGLLASSFDPAEITVIDTAGINPYGGDDRRELAALIEASGAEPLFVLPAGGDAVDTVEMARVFRDFGCSRLVVTRLDMVRRLGSVIATVDALRFTLAEAGMSSAIADGLSSFNPVLLARVLLTTAVRVRRPSLEKTR